MPSGRLIQATVLVISFHVTFVSSSPALAQSVHRPSTHAKSSRTPRQNIPPGVDNPVYHLPPVAVVFKMVADAESRKTPAAAHPAQAAVPTIAAALFPMPVTTTQAPAEATYHSPGLIVVPTSVVYPEPTSPAVDTTVPPDAQQTVYGPAAETSTPARQLILIGIVMGALVVLVFLVYLFLDRRVFAACSRKKKDDSEGSWTKINSPPPPPPSFYESEKDVILYTPPLMELSSASSSSQGSRDSATGPHTPALGHMHARESKVLDIGRNFPRSKFSVTSSDYPYSLVSSARSSGPVLPSPDESHSATSPLLPAYEFFCLPSNPESFEENRHSRAHSVPIFGHAASRDRPDILVRAGEHRRSRSVSGLTYTVIPRERRESGSSAGDWRGSPQSDHGWPSAL